MPFPCVSSALAPKNLKGIALGYGLAYSMGSEFSSRVDVVH
jgi:hypothetical protein